MSYVVLSSADGTGLYGLPATGQVTVYRAGDDGYFRTGVEPGTTPALVQLLGGGPDALLRFVDHGDGTVTDNATGLMWVKDAPALGAPWDDYQAWNDAVDNCLTLTWVGHSDWRLPNINELLALYDYESVDLFAPFGFVAPASSPGVRYPYWSATTDSGATGDAIYLAPDSGVSPNAPLTKAEALMASPVRGGIYNANSPS